MRRLVISVISFMMFFAGIGAASPVSAADNTPQAQSLAIHWEKNSLGSQKSIKATAYNGKDLYVAISSETVKISKDGVNWKEQPLGLELRAKYTSEIYAVTYGTDAFVAVGSEGNILRSRDGIKWERMESGLGQASYVSDKSLYSIVWDGKQYIAVGANGLFITSKDGSRWNVTPYEHVTGQKSNDPWNFYDIKVLDGKYYIVGGSIWKSGAIIRSDNGKDWKVVLKNSEDIIQSIAYNGETLVASGGSGMMFTSRDGLVWSLNKERLPIIWGFDVIWNGSLFFLNAEGTLLQEGSSALRTFTSKDGQAWTELTQWQLKYTGGKAASYPASLNGLLYDGKQMLALNERNEVMTTSSATNLRQWNSADANAKYQKMNASNLIYTGDKYFITPFTFSEGLKVSEDGEHWTSIQEKLQQQTGYNKIFIDQIAWYGEEFVAIGKVWGDGWEFRAFRSPDGYTWSIEPLTVQNISADEYEWLSIEKIELLGSKLLMVGNYYTVKNNQRQVPTGFIATSTDGATWFMPSKPFENIRLYSLAYGDGTYVLTGSKTETTGYGSVSSGSLIYTSHDLTQWSAAYTNESYSVQPLHWNGKQFITSAFDSGTTKFLISADAKTWKVVSLPNKTVPSPNEIAWNGFYYIGVGNYGKLIYSQDGTTWSTLPFVNYTEDLQHIIWDGSRWMTGGPNALFIGTP